jgi:PST family polysaccharide transporter
MKSNSQSNDNSIFSRTDIKKDLKRKSLIGAISKLTSNGTTTAISMISTIILARLLTPKEFGLLAMVTAFTEFARSFQEIGLGSATVQCEETNHDEVSLLFWINAGVGTLIMLVLMGLSPVIAWFYGNTKIIPICAALSTIFLFGGLTVQHRALLERQMKFHYLGAVYVIASLVGLIVAVLLALKTSSVWALVFRDIASGAAFMIGVWLLCRWRPSLPKRKTNIKSSLRFGIQLSGFEILQYVTRSLDQVLIGRFFGPNALGLYSKALQLVSMPIEQFRMIFWDVGFSPLSALQNDPARFRNYYGRLLSVMTFLYMPMTVFIAIEAKDVTRLILGEAWMSAAPLLAIFAVGRFIRPVVSTFQLVMVSCGNSKRCVGWGLANSIGLVAAYSIGIHWNAIGVAYSYAIVSYMLFIWSLFYCFKNTPITIGIVLRSVSIPVITSLCSGVILLLFLSICPLKEVLLNFIVAIFVITFAYLGFWLIIPNGKTHLAELWSYRREIFRSKFKDASKK